MRFHPVHSYVFFSPSWIIISIYLIIVEGPGGGGDGDGGCKFKTEMGSQSGLDFA